MNLPKLKLDWLNKSRPLENRKMGFDEICKNEKCLNFLDKDTNMTTIILNIAQAMTSM